MRINTNASGLVAYNALRGTNTSHERSIGRLSAGLRINSAADDAAGLAVSEKIRSQIQGLDQAVRNSQDGVSLIQTAEGALGEVHSILQRMRELSVQAANDTLTADDRKFIQYEIDELRSEIDRISDTTQFNRKKLLDGSSALLGSADNLDTQALVRGELSGSQGEGNFKISLRAIDAGQAEIQKSNIFKIKHDGAVQVSYSDDSVATIGEIDGTPPGDYTMAIEENSKGGVWVQQSYGFDSYPPPLDIDQFSFFFLPNQSLTASVLFEVKGIDTASGAVTFSVASSTFSYSGETAEFKDEIVITQSGIASGAAYYSNLGFDIPPGALSIDMSGINDYKVGNKMIMKFAFSDFPPVDPSGNDVNISLDGTLNQEWGGAWGEIGLNGADTVFYDRQNWYNIAPTLIAGKSVTLRQFFLNPETGESFNGSLNLRFSDTLPSVTAGLDGRTHTFFKASIAFAGCVATSASSLRDVEDFWDANGRFILDDPKEIRIIQGDGRSAAITLYGSDTLGDVANKFNMAIAEYLGQIKYITGPARLSSVVDEKSPGVEAVRGVMLLRTAVTGGAGRLILSAEQDVLAAFGFNVIQSAREVRYSAHVTDAHSGNLVNDAEFSGNVMTGAVNRGVDVVFDPMIGIDAVWNDATLKYDLTSKPHLAERTLHLADNAAVLQVGANEGENLTLSIADIGVSALGLMDVVVVDRESASRSITVIESAIDRVSSQRALFGAYQNRLEHTITNLTAANQNMTVSESVIRDADMAKEMMEFTKLNILSQVGASMLAQANQSPQNVLSLLR
jgi:flagellin